MIPLGKRPPVVSVARPPVWIHPHARDVNSWAFSDSRLPFVARTEK